MTIAKQLLAVAPDAEDLRLALLRAPDVAVTTAELLPIALSADVAAVLAPRRLLGARLPMWSRRVALVVYDAFLPADEVERLTKAGVFLALSARLSELNLQVILQSATQWADLVRRRDQLQTALARIDLFGRRIAVVENPAALLDDLPYTLSTLLPFDVMAIWDIPQQDLRLFIPFEWDPPQVELITAQVRRLLAAQPEAPEMPVTTLRHEFTVPGRVAPTGLVKHFLCARVGAWRGLLAVFRTGDEPFGEHDDKLFDLAANLITAALHNARLFEHLERQAQKIILKNRELLAANQVKTNFIANISHEIKTPLHSILGLAELLAEADSPEDHAHAVQRIGVNARRLLRIVNDLLDYSRLMSNRETVCLETVALRPLLEEVIDSVHDLADAKGLPVVLQYDIGLTEFRLDREKVFRILTNLLSNAIKFTPGGQVTCRAWSDRTHLRLTVRDTGPGIPADQLHKIFEQFHRVDGPLRSASEGAGLGLTIAQGLAKLLGGEIVVESALGRGSEFALVLPLPHTPSTEPARISAAPKESR